MLAPAGKLSFSLASRFLRRTFSTIKPRLEQVFHYGLAQGRRLSALAGGELYQEFDVVGQVQLTLGFASLGTKRRLFFYVELALGTKKKSLAS